MLKQIRNVLIMATGVCIGMFLMVPIHTPTPAIREVRVEQLLPLHDIGVEPVIIERIKTVPVTVEELPELDPYPWEDVVVKRGKTKPIIDCDTERKNPRLVLACNIYHEARNQSDVGQIAVGLVTKNRMESSRYPDTYVSVVWQIRKVVWVDSEDKVHIRYVPQFTWVKDGKPDRVWDNKAFKKAWRIAGGIIRGEYEDFTEGAMWYHADYVAPPWRHNLERVAVIDDHIFYR